MNSIKHLLNLFSRFPLFKGARGIVSERMTQPLSEDPIDE